MGFLEASKVKDNVESRDPGGKMYPIACNAWFTSGGDSRPLSFKFEGDDGEIILVRNVQVKYVEDKFFSGIPSKEFGCDAIVGGLLREFKLIFYQEACKWVMVI